MTGLKNGSAWATNSHAENTHENGLRLLVDWVTCSFLFTSDIADLLIVLDLEKLPFVEHDFARYEGYRTTYKYDTMEILESDNKYLINFSGQACRIFEQTSTLEWTVLFDLLIDNFGATFTRLDIAIDDFSEIYKTNTIRQATYKKLAVTRLKDWGTSQRGLIVTGNDVLTMDNFYLGNMKSRYMLNIYDKKIEREVKGNQVTVSSWTRTELRFKAEYATRFAEVISAGNESLGYYTMSFLNEKIQFLRPNINFSNRSRAAKNPENVSRWWKKFLGDVGKLNLSEKAPDKTLEDVVKWVDYQVAPSLAMFIKAFGKTKFNDFIDLLLEEGEERLTKKHEMMIETYLQNADDFRKKLNSPETVEKYNDMFARGNKENVAKRKGSEKDKQEYTSKLLDEYLINNFERDVHGNKKMPTDEPTL